MREILFRGKRSDNDEWIEGYYVKCTCGEKDVHCIVPFGKLAEMLWDNCIYQVDPSTVGPNTGLTDKNGVKIFEGDILHFINTYKNMNTEWLCTVEFHEGAFVCRYVEDSEIEAGEMGVWNHFCSWNAPAVQWDIIGNIYDNPELLKGGEGNA